MKYLFLIIIIGFFQVLAIAQTTLKPNEIAADIKYIYLYEDSLITGTELYQEQFNGQDYIYLDGKTYKTQTVKFFKNEYGLFANTTGFFTSGLFADATQIGKINLFELNHEVIIPITNEFGALETIPKMSNYYNIGFEDLKKTTYDNLVIDLKNNPDAMLHLDKYNQVRKTQNVLYVISGIFAVGAIASLSSDADYALGVGVGSGLVAATSLTIGYVLSINKRKHIQSTIRTFNE